MFRSHRYSLGRTHTVTLGILAATMLSTSVAVAAAPDPFLAPADGERSAGSQLSGASFGAAAQLLRRVPPAVRLDPAVIATDRCADAMMQQLIATPACPAAAENLGADLARRALAATQGHRDVPQRRAHGGHAQTETTE